MGDVYSNEVRSFIMSSIRSKDTRPEMLVRKFLHKERFRFRLHSKHLSGKPDIVLAKYKTVIFVHGCFWHGHRNCKAFRPAKSNTAFWELKIATNRERDCENVKILSKGGWKVIIIWECELTKVNLENTLFNLANEIRSVVT